MSEVLKGVFRRLCAWSCLALSKVNISPFLSVYWRWSVRMLGWSRRVEIAFWSNSRASRKISRAKLFDLWLFNYLWRASKRDFKRICKCTRRKAAMEQVKKSIRVEFWKGTRASEGMWPRKSYFQWKWCKQSIKNMNRRTDINPHLDIESDN